MTVYLDTHVCVWLCAGVDLFTDAAREAIEGNDLLISPAVYLELAYLRERNKIASRPAELLSILSADFGVAVSQHRFAALATAAADLEWARDPFDRLIVANAVVDGCQLVTADATIRENYPGAVW